jgi:hypothetical protein
MSLASNTANQQARSHSAAEWTKVQEGVYTGFSQGGAYERRWKNAEGRNRYTAASSTTLAQISICFAVSLNVISVTLPAATFPCCQMTYRQ